MANIAYNNITFNMDHFKGDSDRFIDLFFNRIDHENESIELKSSNLTELFTDEIFKDYITIRTTKAYTALNLVEKINVDTGEDYNIMRVNDALFGFQRYGLGHYDYEDSNKNELKLNCIQSKADIAFPLFYLFAYLGIKTTVHESLDEYGNWYRRNYQVYLNEDDQIVEHCDDYKVDLDPEEFKQASEYFI